MTEKKLNPVRILVRILPEQFSFENQSFKITYLEEM